MDAFNLPSTSGALVIDTDYSQQGGATAAAGAGGAAATGDSSLSALSPTPLTPSAGSSMWGAPASSAGKFIVEMDEGGWMHTYHATVYEAPNGQRVQFRTSGALASPFSSSLAWPAFPSPPLFPAAPAIFPAPAATTRPLMRWPRNKMPRELSPCASAYRRPSLRSCQHRLDAHNDAGRGRATTKLDEQQRRLLRPRALPAGVPLRHRHPSTHPSLHTSKTECAEMEWVAECARAFRAAFARGFG